MIMSPCSDQLNNSISQYNGQLNDSISQSDDNSRYDLTSSDYYYNGLVIPDHLQWAHKNVDVKRIFTFEALYLDDNQCPMFLSATKKIERL